MDGSANWGVMNNPEKNGGGGRGLASMLPHSHRSKSTEYHLSALYAEYWGAIFKQTEPQLAVACQPWKPWQLLRACKLQSDAFQLTSLWDSNKASFLTNWISSCHSKCSMSVSVCYHDHYYETMNIMYVKNDWIITLRHWTPPWMPCEKQQRGQSIPNLRAKTGTWNATSHSSGHMLTPAQCTHRFHQAYGTHRTHLALSIPF